MRKSLIKKMYNDRKNIENMLVSEGVVLKNEIFFEGGKRVTYNQVDRVLAFLHKEDVKPIKQYNDVMSFILDNKMWEVYTIIIIKCIASNKNHFANSSCMDIVNSGYTQTIIDDLKQNVFIELLGMVEKNHIMLENNEIVFDTYINTKEEEVSYFFKLFRVVENTLYNEKKQIESRFKKIKYDIKKHGIKAHFDEHGFLCDKFGTPYQEGIKIEYLDSYNDDVTSTQSSDFKEFLYNINGENSLKNVEFRKDINLFFYTIKKEYPKYYSEFCGIFEGLYKGYTYKEISEMLKISERRIKYLIPLFREKYNDIMVKGIYIKKSIDDNLYCDRTKNTSTTYYINRTKVNVVKPTIKKVQVQEVLYKHTPNYDYDIPQWQREQWQREKEEEQKALHNNATKYIDVIDKKNKCILCINQEGKVLFSYPLHCKDIVKFAKNNGLEIL